MSDVTTNLLELHVTEQQFPRYDAAHGTPDPMVRRLAAITVATAHARFEQTDYGHPGRFNPWAPRGIDTALQARASALLAICEALTPLLA